MMRFVDIYGRAIEGVQSAENGDILIPLSEIKKTGFVIYNESVYDKLLVSEEQFTKEFRLYLLQCAKTYMLERKFHFSEEQVKQTIINVEKEISAHNDKQFESGILCESSSGDSPKSGISDTSMLTVKNLNEFNKPALAETNDRKGNSRSSSGNTSFESRNGSNSRKVNGSLKNYDNKRNRNNGNSSTNNNNNKTNGMSQQSDDRKSQDDLSDSSQRRNKPRYFTDPNPDALSLEPNIVYEGIVSYVDPSKTTIAWIHINEAPVQQILQELNADDLLPDTPVINELFAAQEDGDLWYRCKVESLHPLRVFFVDYGNTVTVNEVRKLPEHLKTLPYQAVRISYRTNEFGTLESEQRIKFKMQYRHVDKTYNITLATKKFNGGISANVTNSFNNKQFDNKIEEPQTVPALSSSQTSPIINKTTSTPLEPQTSPSEELKVSPMIFEGTPPPQSVQQRLSSPRQQQQLQQLLQHRQHQQQQPQMLKPLPELSKIKSPTLLLPKTPSPLRDTPLTTPQPMQQGNIKKVHKFFEMPPPATQLKDNMQVRIDDVNNGHFILRTKEDYMNLKEINEILEKFEAEPVTDLQKNELVICPNASRKGLARARIESIENDYIRVRYLDYSEVSDLYIKLIKPITETLAKKRLTYTKSEKFVYNFDTSKAKEYINILSTKKPPRKFTVKFVAPDKMDFIDEDGLRLSDILKDIEGSPSKRLMFNDVKEVIPKIGVDTYLMCGVHKDNICLVIPNNFADSLGDVVCTEDELKDETPYTPILNEVCLAKFEGDWYRAVIRDKDEKYFCKFIDFRNEDKIEPKDIRALPEKMKTIPIYGFLAEFTGSNPKKILDELTANETTDLTLKVIGLNDSKDGYLVQLIK